MVIATVFAIMIATGAIRPWSILALAFVYGTIMSFVFPTRNAIVPNLVSREDLVTAVALNAADRTPHASSDHRSPACSSPSSVSGTFAVAAAMQILALLWTAQLPKMVSDITVRSASLWRNVMEGVEAVARDEFLKGMILLAGLVTILVMPYINLMPVFARDEMGLGATGLGVLMACSGSGSVLGALAVARWRALGYVRGIQVWSAIAFAALVIVFAFTSIIVAAGLLLFIADSSARRTSPSTRRCCSCESTTPFAVVSCRSIC